MKKTQGFDGSTSAVAAANVAETARWVAAYRGWETARADALFHDPYAARLAGERGEQIARNVSRSLGTGNGWPIITRTKLLDDMVQASVAAGTRCVLNLAAGLDTRPYRMNLPASLRWIEADVSEVFDLKEAVLEGEQARCELTRVRIDLADADAREQLFDRVNALGEKTLVITEGLVMYLETQMVAELGRAIGKREHFSEWALDFSAAALLRELQRTMATTLVNAPMKFGPENGVAFFEELGFHAAQVHSLFHEGARYKRVPWPLRLFALLPAPNPRAPAKERWSGVVRFERAVRPV